MHFKTINQKEESFLDNQLNKLYVIEPFEIPINGEDLNLKGYTCRRSDGENTYFFSNRPKKEKIVLHFTAGHFQGDLQTLTQPGYRVSVPFLIARDGTIYQLFSSASWAYHLGRTAIGGNTKESKKSIAIELSNYGYLLKNGEHLETIYASHGDPSYCTLEDTDYYTKLSHPFREQEFFATYTDKQYESLIILIRYLTALYEIPREFLSNKNRHKATRDVVDFKGILSHVNYRHHGKWDIGPAFDWDRLIAGVTAEKYSPGSSKALSLKDQIAEAERQIINAKERIKRLETLKASLEEELDNLNTFTPRSVEFEPDPIFKSEQEIENRYPPSPSDDFDPEFYQEEGLGM